MSHEKTITVEIDGNHYNIPTVVDGIERTKDEAVQRAIASRTLGRPFASTADAVAAAQARSDSFNSKGDPVTDSFNPMALRDKYVQAYKVFGRPPERIPYNPILEDVVAQAIQPKPTTSSGLSILHGLLGAYVGNEMGKAKMAYAESSRAREKQDALDEWTRQHDIQLKDKMTAFGTEHAMKQAEEYADPTKYNPMTASQRGNLDTITSLMGSNPEFQRALANDPSWGVKTERAVAQGLGLTPYRKPEKLSEGERLVSPDTGKEIVPAIEKFTYKDRTRDVGKNKLFEYSTDGGRTWKQEGPASPRNVGGEGSDSGVLDKDKHVKLAVQKEITDGLRDFFSIDRIDEQGNHVKDLPVEQRDIHLATSARAIQIIEHDPSISVPAAQNLALKEARDSGRLKVAPDQSIFPMSDLGFGPQPGAIPVPGGPPGSRGVSFAGAPAAPPAEPGAGGPPAGVPPTAKPILDLPAIAQSLGLTIPTAPPPIPSPPMAVGPTLRPAISTPPSIPQTPAANAPRPQQDEHGQWFIDAGQGRKKYLTTNELELLLSKLKPANEPVSVGP